MSDMHELIDSKTADLELLLSGSGLTVERFRATAYQLWDRNFAVRKCTPQSVLSGIMAIAEVGLTLAPSLGHAYLVPFNNTAVPIIGYRGLIHLALKSGGALDIRAGVVRKGELFKYRPLHPTEPLVHEPTVDEDTGEVTTANNPTTGYYAVAYLHNGLVKAEYMTRGQVEKHRDKYSRAAKDGPWVSQFDDMAMKTCVRKLSRYLKLSGNPDDVRRFEKAVEATPVVEQSEDSGELTEDETPRAAVSTHSDPEHESHQRKSAVFPHVQGDGSQASAVISDGAEADGKPDVAEQDKQKDAPADDAEKAMVASMFNRCKAPFLKKLAALKTVPGFTSIEELRKAQFEPCAEALQKL